MRDAMSPGPAAAAHGVPAAPDRGAGASPVSMRGISKSFGAVRAVERVDLDLYAGEILGLVGDNAAGKSTLMKILSGVLLPDEGTIMLDGNEVRFRSPLDARQLGIEMIYQDFALCPNLSAASNIFLGREPVRSYLAGLVRLLDWKGMEAHASRILDRIHIHIDSVRHAVEHLSGGQQQAVAIGRAIGFNARVLIMDEPTASLSVKEVGKVLEFAREARSRGISIIFISHRLQDIFAIGDRVMVLKRGRSVGVRRVDQTTMDEVVSLIVKGTT